MAREFLCIAACLFGLFGCASAPPASPPLQFAWADQVFDYDPSLVTVTKEDLFRLDPDLFATLKSPAVQRLSTTKRLERLIALLYGQEVRRFGYAAGHSTVASMTWRQKRGDCLSLTVLAYAMAQAMNLEAQIQEVPIAAVFDRRDQLDFLSQHVNVRFRNASPMDLPHGTSTMQSRDMIVDFEPEAGGRHIGTELSDQAILARYYNNIAAEHLAKGRDALAYAHFKAAILTDPGFAASYGNLAVLLRGKGLLAQAEQLLRHAIALGGQSYVPLQALHQLLQVQGRNDEALVIERELQAKRDIDPYHWIAFGLRHLQAGDFRAAIRALERAQKLTTGFEEVHQYLALAYWRAGEQAQAEQQLALLGTLSSDGAGVARLQKKLNASP
jgi:tetratricopeptide (TPR) repeat protein